VKKLLVLILSLAVLGIGCKDRENGVELVRVIKVDVVGKVREHVTDIEYWDGKLWMGAYYWKSSDRVPKLYIYSPSCNNFYNYTLPNKHYESIYRVWVNGNGEKLSFSTEQPPTWWQKDKNGSWRFMQRYHSKGWAVLGDTLSNGIEVRGWSSHFAHNAIYYYDNGWKQMSSVIGPGNKKRIVWAMEWYRGDYYACTSPSDAYSQSNTGNVYKLVNGNWEAVLGFDSDMVIGGAICCLAVGDRLFVGTCRPQSIWDYDGRSWEEYKIGSEGEVAKIWSDSKGRIFAGAHSGNEVFVLQWNEKDDSWEVIYRVSAMSSKWSVMGVCSRDEEGVMFVKYRDEEETKVVKIMYN